MWTSLVKIFHSKYFTWITLLTLLPLNYITLFTSVEVLWFSHFQSSEFSKSNKPNRLAGLSLAQLSPSLFPSFFPLSFSIFFNFSFSSFSQRRSAPIKKNFLKSRLERPYYCREVILFFCIWGVYVAPRGERVPQVPLGWHFL